VIAYALTSLPNPKKDLAKVCVVLHSKQLVKQEIINNNTDFEQEFNEKCLKEINVYDELNKIYAKNPEAQKLFNESLEKAEKIKKIKASKEREIFKSAKKEQRRNGGAIALDNWYEDKKLQKQIDGIMVSDNKQDIQHQIQETFKNIKPHQGLLQN
jgi:hypothetical protein